MKWLSPTLLWKCQLFTTLLYHVKTMEHHLASMGLLIFLIFLLSLPATMVSTTSSPDRSLRGLIPVRTQLSPDRESFLGSVRELIAVKGVIVLQPNDPGGVSVSSTLPLRITS